MSSKPRSDNDEASQASSSGTGSGSDSEGGEMGPSMGVKADEEGGSRKGSSEHRDQEEEEGRGEKKRSSKDKDQKKDKKKKKEKKHKKEKRKRDDDSDTDKKRRRKEEKEEKRLVKEARRYLEKEKKKEKKEKEDDGPPLRPIPEVLSAVDDYYRRQTEFRVWLRQVKNTSFEMLSRDKAQEQFEKFVKEWNKGKLEDMYYSGIPVHLQTESHKTTHKWGFANKMNEEEKYSLERMANSITRVTTERPAGAPPPTSSSSSHRPGGGKSAGDAQYEREQRREEERARKHSTHKHTRDTNKAAMEEHFPKATGREALIEARQARGDRLHGAARAKEDARDGLDVPEAMLGLGGGGDEADEMRRRMARAKERGNARQEEKERKVEEYKNKEKEAMQKLMNDLGLKPGQKIVIPKRAPADDG